MYGEEKSLIVETLESLQFSAWDHDQEAIDGGDSKGGVSGVNKTPSAHPHEVERSVFIHLNLDLIQMGVGGDDSWGSKPYPPYLIHPGNYSYSYRLSVR